MLNHVSNEELMSCMVCFYD